MTSYNSELEDKVKQLVPQSGCQFGCNGEGSYMEMSEREAPIQAQCEYCYVVRFPIIEKLLALIESERQSAQIEVLKRVKYRLPSPENNVEEWKGHNLGLSQAIIVVDDELSQLSEEEL